MDASPLSSPFLPLPEGILISSICSNATELVVGIACHTLFAHCPCCGTRSERIHGHYQRTVADLPCGGRHVILALTVRKFVCAESSCPQQIFTERLAALVQSYARITNRLREALIALGLATSAQVVERVAPRLALRVSAPTLLRRLREVSCPSPKAVRILGVDDWGATRSCMYSCKDSRKEDLTWGSAPKCPTRLNQVRLGQRSRAHTSDLKTVRGRDDCEHQAVRREARSMVWLMKVNRC